MSAAVVKLPTAAPRKVTNDRWKEQRCAGRALLREQGVFGFPLHPNREAVIKAERLADFMECHAPMTPATGVVIGLIRLLNPEQLESLCHSVRGSLEALTLAELAKADSCVSHLVHVVLDRRGLQ